MDLQDHRPAERCRFIHAGKRIRPATSDSSFRVKQTCGEQSFRQPCQQSPTQKDGPQERCGKPDQLLMIPRKGRVFACNQK